MTSSSGPEITQYLSTTPDATTFFDDITNTTGTPGTPLAPSRKISVAPTAIQFTFGVIGNCLAIWVVVRGAKKHKWRIFYRLVASLAVTDLLGIVATSPVAFAVYANNLKWVGGKPLCDYLAFMLIFAGLATVFIVAAMSFDRFVAVWYPYFYNASLQKRRVHVIIALLWVIAMLIACLPLMGLGHNVLQFPGTWCFFDFFGTTTSDKIYAYFYASIGISMITLTLVLNILVVVMLAKNKRQLYISTRKNSIGSTKSVKSRRNDVFIMIFLVVLLVIFGTCWIPLMIRIMINSSGLVLPNRRADLMAVRLASINQILDPWVYILFRKDMMLRIIRFGKKHSKPGSLFHQLSSRSGSFRTGAEVSTSTTIEMADLEKKYPMVKGKKLMPDVSTDMLSTSVSETVAATSSVPPTEANI